MQKLLILPILLASHMGLSQIPSYAGLTNLQKLKFLNYYGYIKTNQGDTVFCILKTIKDGKFIAKYPKELKNYRGQDGYLISNVHSYFQGIPKHGYPKEYRYVKKYENDYLILERIVEGQISVFRRSIIDMNNNYYGGDVANMHNTITYAYYFESNTDQIELIYKSSFTKKKIRESLKNYFNGSQFIGEIETMGMKENEILEFVQRHNREVKDN